MTTRQIKKALAAAGFEMSHFEIRRDEIEVMVPDEENAGVADYDKSEELMKRVGEVLPSFKGGYRTGYGAWVLQESPLDMGDWNDPSSRWHY